jgi:hypothetical protein
VKEQRASWQAAQPWIDPAKLVFVDETWASTDMARRYGRCPKGERLVEAIPHGHWKVTTFVAALRQDGLVAPMTCDVLPRRLATARFLPMGRLRR